MNAGPQGPRSLAWPGLLGSGLHGSALRAKLASVAPVLLLTAAFALVLVVISPLYEVPQNDDWAYFMTVQRWLDTGRLQHLGWNDPTLVLQAAWGALFARLFGMTYTALRASTLVLSWLGILSMYGLLRALGARKGVALLGAGVLLFNPIVLVLSYSFNTEVPYLALATLATWLFVRARAAESIRAVLLAGMVAACAFLIRQQGLILAGVAAIWIAMLPRPRLRKPAAVAAAAGPSLVAFALHSIWFRHVTAGQSPTGLGNLHAFFETRSGSDFAAMTVQAGTETVAGLLGQGILLVPMIVAGIGALPHLVRRRRAAWVLLPLVLAVFIAMTLHLTAGQPRMQKGWPFQGNYITRAGTLPQPSAAPLLSRPVWRRVGECSPLPAALAAAALLLLLIERRRPGAGAARFVVLAGVAQIAPALAAASIYDRYFVLLLPALVTGLALWVPIGRKALVAGAAGLLLLAGLSLEWTRGYTDGARANWGAAEDAVRQGVPPEQIDAGFEWQGAHLYLRALTELGARPPFRLDRDGYPWAPLFKGRYTVEDRPRVEVPVLAQRDYRPFLTRRMHHLIVRGPAR